MKMFASVTKPRFPVKLGDEAKFMCTIVLELLWCPSFLLSLQHNDYLCRSTSLLGRDAYIGKERKLEASG